MDEFDIENSVVATLGVTTYLLGLATGSLVVAPLSELYGRKPVYLICMIIFTLLIIPCCVASSLAEIIVVRYFG
jgi:MFS family permease